MGCPVVFANELTCPEPLSSILPRDWARWPARRGAGQRQTGQEPVVQEKGGEFAEMLSLYMKLRSLTTRQEGQGMVEYALILVLVSIVVIVILLTMGNQIKNVFSNVVAALGA
jgi:pilus assembly protein Flp/PilA